MSKRQQCVDLFNQYQQLSRQEIIELFVSQLGMKKTTASTYYSYAKNHAKPTQTFLNPELEELLLNRVKELVDIVNTHYNVNMDVPLIEYIDNAKYGGMAYYQQQRIRFNKQLYIDNVEEFLAQTVPHEVAHLAHWVVNQREVINGARHAGMWITLMKLFGAEVRRGHRFKTVGHSRTKPKYEYRCNCTTHMVGPVRHRNIQQQTQHLRCRSCGATISKQSFVRELGKITSSEYKELKAAEKEDC